MTTRGRGVKRGLTAVASILVAPMALPVRWAAPWDRRDAFFQLGSQCMSLFPGLPGVYLRRAYYRMVLNVMGEDVVIDFGSVLAQRDIDIGNRVYIGAFCNIGKSRIGDDVLLGSHVSVVSGKYVHNFDSTDRPIREQGGQLVKIAVGDGSWVGNNAVIMADTGEQVVVGAGTVITHRCEAFGVFAGNPARKIRTRGQRAEDPVLAQDGGADGALAMKS